MNGLFTFPWKEIKNRNKAELQNICQQLCIPFSKGTNKNDLIKNVLVNMGTGKGVSVTELISIASKILGVKPVINNFFNMYLLIDWNWLLCR